MSVAAAEEEAGERMCGCVCATAYSGEEAITEADAEGDAFPAAEYSEMAAGSPDGAPAEQAGGFIRDDM
jgi:hypothetical protein